MSHIDELKDLLQQDIEQLEQLSDTLAQEKSLLAQADVTALEPIIQSKNDALDQIRLRAKAKIRLLVNVGYKPTMGAPSRFIESAGLSEVLSLWLRADSALQKCQEANKANGRVILHLQKRLSRLTDIFRGVSNHDKLYGAQGEQRAVSHSQVLASA